MGDGEPDVAGQFDMLWNCSQSFAFPLIQTKQSKVTEPIVQDSKSQAQ